MSKKPTTYYVPEQSYWPITGAVGLVLFVIGIASMLHEKSYGQYVFMSGSFILVFMMYGWFRDVIVESLSNKYSEQMHLSFRWGMIWFIFSEVMFFVALFGVLFYVRQFAIPHLGDPNSSTNQLLWPDFSASWPLLNNPDPKEFIGPVEAMQPWGLPTLNTLLLLTSGGTLTVAHWALQKNNRRLLIIGLALTVLLGVVFLYCQMLEYVHAYTELKLKFNSGIYGSTFFMLTGFHGAHVTIGSIMLFIVMLRSIKGHFSHEEHFAFEATAWYWHFVDVVWLILYVFVYWI